MKRFVSFGLFIMFLSLTVLACGTLAAAVPTLTPPPPLTAAPTNTKAPEPAQSAPAPGNIIIFEETLAAGLSDGYSVLAFGGNSISAEVAPDGDLDLRLEIQNIDKNVVAAVNDSGPGGKELLTYAFPPDSSLDVYYIVVIAESGEAAYKAAWTGTQGIAFDMKANYVVASYVDGNGYSLYAITTEAGDTLQAVANPVEGESIDPVVRVYKLTDVNTVLVEFNAAGPGDKELITYAIPEKGVYFLEVRDANNNGGRFIFEAELE